MSQYFLPFRGDIVDLAARGRRILIAVRHSEGQPLRAQQIDLEDLLVMGAQMDALQAVGPEADVDCLVTDDNAVYFGTTDGVVYVEDDDGLREVVRMDAPARRLGLLKGDRLLVLLPNAAVIYARSSCNELERFVYDSHHRDGDSGRWFPLRPGSGERPGPAQLRARRRIPRGVPAR
ncbi:MAG: hypothetical protein AAFV53_12340 [Myxococcota bacterium]